MESSGTAALVGGVILEEGDRVHTRGEIVRGIFLSGSARVVARGVIHRQCGFATAAMKFDVIFIPARAGLLRRLHEFFM